MKRRWVEVKYDFLWAFGSLGCFVIYWTGLFYLYEQFRLRIRKKTQKIILMYHRINEDGTMPSLTVSPKNFERQMRYVKNKFRVCSIGELIEGVDADKSCDADSIAITFDDGFRDNFVFAFPILREKNIPATIFLVSDFIGNRHDFLNVSQIEHMMDSGIDFGSHTRTHPILSKMDIEAAGREVRESKSKLEQILGEKVRYFAYPKGKETDFDETVKKEVRKAGYAAAFSTINGCIDKSSDLFALNRIGMRDYPLFVFKVRLCGIFEGRLFSFIRKMLSIR